MSTQHTDLSFAAIAGRRAAVASPGFPALVTIETAERLAYRALNILTDKATPRDVATEHAVLLLQELTAHTTARTAMDVRDQDATDAISAKATDTVRSVIEALDPDNREIADRYSRLEGRYLP